LNYYQLTIPSAVSENRDLLIAALTEAGIEGFEEHETHLIAFVSEADYKEDDINAVLNESGLKADMETIAPRNWNAEWEADFEPVIIDDFCTIRAHFHTIPVSTKYDIVITPKMSFGTGHHATTHLMVAQMEEIDFNNKSVFDFGTGTGVLAILAEKLGATKVVAIDNDEWSYENTKENILLNNCNHIDVSMDAIETLASKHAFDIILANINRHILLNYMETMHSLISANGTLLMSGLLSEDETMVSKSAIDAGFTIRKVNTRNNWITILCKKS
jgi:ribosomal protein L11 methyltransferase